MGKGLIPADLETWKPRRRAIVPAFHKAYLDAMVAMFGRCTQETIRSLDALTEGGAQVPFCSQAMPHSPCSATASFLQHCPIVKAAQDEQNVFWPLIP